MKITKFFFVLLVSTCFCHPIWSQSYVLNFLETGVSSRDASLIISSSGNSLYESVIPSAKTKGSEKVTHHDEGTHKDIEIEVDHGKVYPEFNFKNQLTGNLISQYNLGFSDYMFVEETMPKIKWEIFDEEKMIADTYRCKKAVGDFRGRTYTVWFTEKIPIPSGPWKLGGLPGLILEATETEGKFAFHFVSLKRLDQKIDLDAKAKTLKVNPNEKPMSWKIFKSKLKKKIDDMTRMILARISEKYGANDESSNISSTISIREKSILEEL